MSWRMKKGSGMTTALAQINSKHRTLLMRCKVLFYVSLEQLCPREA